MGRQFIHPLVTEICRSERIAVDSILGQTRTARVARIRHVCAYVLKTSGLSLNEVARELRRKDHSTIVNSIRRVDQSPDLISMAAKYRPMVLKISANINEQIRWHRKQAARLEALRPS